MKLFVHASIFSVVFAGFVAGAVTIKPTDHVTASHSLVVSHAMPVPMCPPGDACFRRAKNSTNATSGSTQTVHM